MTQKPRPYLSCFLDHHGKRRWRYPRNGKTVALPVAIEQRKGGKIGKRCHGPRHPPAHGQKTAWLRTLELEARLTGVFI